MHCILISRSLLRPEVGLRQDAKRTVLRKKLYLQVLEEPNGEIKILANPFLMDFDKPLTIVVGDKKKTVELKPDKTIVEESLNETGDMLLGWADEISVE